MAGERPATNIGEMLLREELVTQKQLELAMQTKRETHKPLGRILVEMGLISESVKMDFLRRGTGCPTVILGEETIEQPVIQLIPANLATRFHVVPVRLERGGLLVAMEDPTNLFVLDQLEEIVPMPVIPAISRMTEIAEAIRRYYGDAESGAEVFSPVVVRPLWNRMLRMFFTPLLMFAPWPAIILLYRNYEPFKEALLGSGFNGFDAFLYVFLGWGMWSVISWTIGGYLFNREAGPPEEPGP